jgi:undecaprenyl-diphosphatase
MDKQILSFLNHLPIKIPGGDQIVVFLATYFGWVLLAGLVVYIWFAYDRTRAFWQVLVAIFSGLLAWFCASLVKYNFHIDRPFQDLSNIRLLIDVGRGESFPSGHTSLFAGLGTALYFYDHKWGVIYLVSALAIGAARVSAGAHWPSDILVGFVFGFVAAWLVHQTLIYLKNTL